MGLNVDVRIDGDCVMSFRAGSYGGYNRYREALCRMALNVTPEDVWGSPQTFEDQPFYRQINFSDCEGTLDTAACRDLADAYKRHVGTAAQTLDDYDMRTYVLFMSAFRLAAEMDGTVKYL